MRRQVFLLLVLPLGLTGCVEILFGVAGAISSGVGIYQRYEDRQVQKDQTAEIKALREEIARSRGVLHDDLSQP